MVEEYKKVNISVYICQTQGIKKFFKKILLMLKKILIFIFILDSFIERINRMDLFSQFKNHLFITIEDAISYIQNENSKAKN